eukprot:gene21370-6112_t
MITPSRNLTDARLQSRICGPACGGFNAACRAMCTVSLVKIGADIGMLDSTKAINELYDAINDLRAALRLLLLDNYFTALGAEPIARTPRRIERPEAKKWGK